MRRLLASVLIVWYAVLATGFHLHIHYCCGQVADVAINRTADECTTSCASHHAPKKTEEVSCCLKKSEVAHTACSHPLADEGDSLKKDCCSSDDFYIVLEDLHQKSDFDWMTVAFVNDHPAVQAVNTTSHKKAIRAAQTNHTGPPLYEMNVQRIFYA